MIKATEQTSNYSSFWTETNRNNETTTTKSEKEETKNKPRKESNLHSDEEIV